MTLKIEYATGSENHASSQGHLSPGTLEHYAATRRTITERLKAMSGKYTSQQ
jgi:hypothetical protein